MTALLRTLLSLALSGSVLILLLLLLLPRLRGRTSRRWQYYIWLAAVLRLLVPFAPEASLMNQLFAPPAAVSQFPPGGGQLRPGAARWGGTGR